ncbi:MAG: hypothetical protein Cpurp_11375 [Chlorogloea purpurea SAG 13.99]|jgi:hypothetical protein|nr:hypothetical protein [Chlorogloea purpurea SAG 13.99]
MTQEAQVKKYLAYWFLLGKPIIINNGKETLLPKPIFVGQQYSPQFEACWQKITDKNNGDCYLEGTQQTIQELLSPLWDLDPCARCSMPVPQKIGGAPVLNCTCQDLENWPNSELPPPNLPSDNGVKLARIRQTLMAKNKD